MPTTRDIAARAGVSHSTVALALKNNPKIPAKTRERIQKVAKEMGWKPNFLVSAYQHSVATGRLSQHRETVAWLKISKANLLWEEVLGYKTAQEFADNFGWRVDPFSLRDYGMTDESGGEEYLAKALSVIKSRGIRGIIIPKRSRLQLSTIQDLSKDFIVVSLFGEQYADRQTSRKARPSVHHTINPDYFANSQRATNKLWGMGYSRIGLCLKAWTNWVTNEKVVGGYQTAICPCPRFPPLLLQDELEHQPLDKFKQWVEEFKLDAIVCGNSEIPTWLDRLGYAVPENMGVAHFQLGPAEKLWSGIDIRFPKLIQNALQMLNFHLIQNDFGEPVISQNLECPGNWVDGDTTKRVQKVDRLDQIQTEWSPSQPFYPSNYGNYY